MSLPHIDFSKRKAVHTNYAIEIATQLPATPILLQIFYPSMYGTSPPSYFYLVRGVATPVSRLVSTGLSYILKLTIMPNREMVFLWTR